MLLEVHFAKIIKMFLVIFTMLESDKFCLNLNAIYIHFTRYSDALKACEPNSKLDVEFAGTILCIKMFLLVAFSYVVV